MRAGMIVRNLCNTTRLGWIRTATASNVGASVQDDLAPETAHFQTWRSALEEPWYLTPWIGYSRGRDDRRGRRRAVLRLGVLSPPAPAVPSSQAWCDMYDPATVAISKCPSGDLTGRPWWHEAFLISASARFRAPIQRRRQELGALGELTEAALQDITAIYFGMISAVDLQVGRILSKLEETGLAEDTIIIFISDHGEWLGDHGLLLKARSSMTDCCGCRASSGGRGLPAGVVVGDPVSTVDIRSTVAVFRARSCICRPRSIVARAVGRRKPRIRVE